MVSYLICSHFRGDDFQLRAEFKREFQSLKHKSCCTSWLLKSDVRAQLRFGGICFGVSYTPWCNTCKQSQAEQELILGLPFPNLTMRSISAPLAASEKEATAASVCYRNVGQLGCIWEPLGEWWTERLEETEQGSTWDLRCSGVRWHYHHGGDECIGFHITNTLHDKVGKKPSSWSIHKGHWVGMKETSDRAAA